MTNTNAITINLIKRDNDYFVSSKEVSFRFGKKHKNVLRNIDNLQVSENFARLNFEPGVEKDINGIDQRVFYMTKDGFSILAFGFTGADAMQWKENFLMAFNKMEEYIKEKMPLLEARIKSLETEKDLILLERKKLPHPNKNTVTIPIAVNTLFGPDIEYKRVKRDDKNYSELAYKEGKLKQLSQCQVGIARTIDQLTKEIALQRRN